MCCPADGLEYVLRVLLELLEYSAAKAQAAVDDKCALTLVFRGWGKPRGILISNYQYQYQALHLENPGMLPDTPHKGLVSDFERVDDAPEARRPGGRLPGCRIIPPDACAQVLNPLPEAVFISVTLLPATVQATP